MASGPGGNAGRRVERRRRSVPAAAAVAPAASHTARFIGPLRDRIRPTAIVPSSPLWLSSLELGSNPDVQRTRWLPGPFAIRSDEAAARPSAMPP
jgi:hypothetical protein